MSIASSDEPKNVKDAKISAQKVKETISEREMWYLNWNFQFFGFDFDIVNTDPVKTTTIQLHVIDYKRDVTLILFSTA